MHPLPVLVPGICLILFVHLLFVFLALLNTHFCVYIFFLLSSQLFCKPVYCLIFQSHSLSEDMLGGIRELQSNTGSYCSEGFHVLPSAYASGAMQGNRVHA